MAYTGSAAQTSLVTRVNRQLEDDDAPGGVSPFVVERSEGAGGPWAELTPPEGTSGSSWIDAGAAADGVTYYYRVVPLP